MLPEKIHLEIVTPSRRVLVRDVDEVVLPGAEGSFGVLPGHAPMLAGLQCGVAEVRNGSERDILAIGAGVAEVGPDRVTVLAETAERAAEIDAERARRKAGEYLEQLKRELSETDLEVVRFKMQKHLARLSATERAS
ncbi:MAG: F0F1 ATP synthase subunit epsilon [Acidobacteria bacterium]|jgi:F-type H+-transporting ATPase subunit epsilon|nr:F0F1 ATP synthase subunit epsilon [Acidobacteriota bacterium]